MDIASSFRMREIDRISIEEKGFGELLLMENAGIRILEEAAGTAGFNDQTVLCIAGTGNNGGDALVIARQIFSRMRNQVIIAVTGKNGSAAFEFNLALCRNIGMTILDLSEHSSMAGIVFSAVKNAGIIFDGLAGTGIRGVLREPAASLVQAVNESDAVCFSVDVPSGVGEGFIKGYPAVEADYTLTVGLPKRCLYLPAARPYCGEIRTIEIGFPKDVLSNGHLEQDGRNWRLYSEDDIKSLMPVLAPDDYKNSRGHLAVFAGSPGTTGAASLCAEAGARTSAGLVTLFADSAVYQLLSSRHRAVMVKEAADESVISGLKRFGAVSAGPGWGITGHDEIFDRILVEGRGVLDADALTILARKAAKGDVPDLGCRWVLTPHPGEFSRMMPGTDPLEDPYLAITAAAEKFNCIVLLKGAVTFIASPNGKYAVIDGCFPKLGTAGSGDTLCGLIGGYAASGMELFNAAVLGVLLQLRAAKCCSSEKEWFTADDILEFIGRRC